MKYLFLIPLLVLSLSAQADNADFEDLDLEALLAADVQITSAMKRTNMASETAASVYVLTHEKIKSSGVSSIPQALKLVPGMQVRRIDNNKWAIGLRSVAGRYSSRLLVMIDGQSIYNPSFSGVYWEALNYPIEDIERIEVIRGQGGVLWSSNATNGVVNIITKMAFDTSSTYVNVGTGTHLPYDATIRTGGELSMGDHASYRIYANSRKTDGADESYKWLPNDDGEKLSIGGRLDVAISDETSLIVQGDYTDIDVGQTLSLTQDLIWRSELNNSNEKRTHTQLMARIDNRMTDNASQMLQLSYSNQKGEQPYYQESFKHYDLDYQLNMFFDDIQINAGANYRYNETPFTETRYIKSINNIESVDLFGVFGQVSIPIADAAHLILGNKSEHNNLTDWEHQPSVRLAWQSNERHFFWSSLSRGVRIPSLLEFDYSTLINGFEIGDIYQTGNYTLDNMRIKTTLEGNNQLAAEDILATELGYRYKTDNWLFDFSLFYSEHKNALTLMPSVSDISPETVAQLFFSRNIAGLQQYLATQSSQLNFVSDGKMRAKGFELVSNWHISTTLFAEFGYSYSDQRHNHASSSLLRVNGKLEQLFFSLNKKLGEAHNVNAILRVEDGDLYNVDDYGVLDISWRWQLQPNLSLTVLGENLTESSHLEFARTNELFDIPTYIDRRFSLALAYEF